jgi:hypothetical protein
LTGADGELHSCPPRPSGFLSESLADCHAGLFFGGDSVAQPLGTKGGWAPFPVLKESFPMATNNPRHGYERKRSQIKTKTMGQKHWTKRSRKTGEFMDQKKAGKFKSVRREKTA